MAEIEDEVGMMTCGHCGGTKQVIDAAWQPAPCPLCRGTGEVSTLRQCSACKGTGEGGWDSEGTHLPCAPCGGRGGFRMRKDPVLMREVIDLRIE